IFLKKEDFITAGIYFQMSIDLNPNFPWSYHNLGIVMENLGIIEQAIFCYEKVVELNPDFVGGYQKLATIQEELGDSSQLIKNYQKIIELKPESWWICQKLGVLLENQGELERAIAIYQQAIKLNPELVNIYSKLGKIYDKLDNKSALIATYHKIIEFNPESWQIYQKLAVLLIEQGNLDEAIALSEKMIKLKPHDGKIYQNLGLLLEKQGEWAKAIKFYQKIINLYPVELQLEFTWVYSYLAKIYEKLNNLPKAIECCKQVLQVANLKSIDHTTISNYYSQLGQLYDKQGETKQAIIHLLKSLKYQPNNLNTYTMIGDILKAQGQEKEANTCYCYQLPIRILKEYCQLPENYGILAHQSAEVTCINTHPGQKIQMSKSLGIENKSIKHFIPTVMTSQPIFLAILNNARFWSDGRHNAVFTNQNKLVKDLSAGCPEIVLCSEYLPIPEKLSGMVGFLAKQWGGGYFHWMLEMFPRFTSLVKAGFSLSELNHIIVNRSDFHFAKECLEKIGLNQDHAKVISVPQKSHWQAEQLLVPSLPTNHQCKLLFMPGTDSFLRKIFLSNDLLNSDIEKKYPQRLYISRDLAYQRKIANEEELVNTLNNYGFQRVFLEKLSVQEQARYLFYAKVVISPHGAGLTNLVFCQAGTKVLEIFSPQFIPNCYWQLSNFCNLIHYHLLGEPFSDNIMPVRGKDILVNIEKLKRLLKFIGIA
ncbi:MAG: tetratricopeptide repeat protein, partial [Microcoleaceae cyanobacterium]